MTITNWLLYVVAVFILTVTPGSCVLMCISTSVNFGARKGLVAALGSTMAITGIMTLSALGLGAALAASETLFIALKWLGAAYLAYLGVVALLSNSTEISVSCDIALMSNRRIFVKDSLHKSAPPSAQTLSDDETNEPHYERI